MVKHGRKEQFSITIDSELADKIYDYIEKHDILYKNLAFELLLKRAFEHIELMEDYEINQWRLFQSATSMMNDLVKVYAKKNKTLQKFIKLHYDELKTKFSERKIALDIP